MTLYNPVYRFLQAGPGGGSLLPPQIKNEAQACDFRLLGGFRGLGFRVQGLEFRFWGVGFVKSIMIRSGLVFFFFLMRLRV